MKASAGAGAQERQQAQQFRASQNGPGVAAFRAHQLSRTQRSKLDHRGGDMGLIRRDPWETAGRQQGDEVPLSCRKGRAETNPGQTSPLGKEATMKRLAHWKIGAWVIAMGTGMTLGLAGCGDDPAGPSTMVDNGSWYVTGFRWPHDGHPYESANFTIYSDAASEQARRSLAQIAEDALADVSAQLGISGRQAFRFPEGQQKIHIYTYKGYTPLSWGGWAYWGGLMIYSLDHPDRSEWGHTELSMYVPVVRHEIMHVIESLLKATNNPGTVDVWLTEGIAEFMAGGTAGGSITTRARFDQLIATYGQLNPIAMHKYTDYPSIANIAFEYCYPMFQLAATYLFDQQGYGARLENLRDLYVDVRDGVVFAAAFANRFGLSLADFETQFFTLMNDYLGRLP